MARYSRYATLEERRNIRRAFLYGILTLVALAFLFTLGIPTLAKFAGFLTDLNKGGKPIEKNDTTPPAPPRINDLPNFTNQVSIDVSGTTEPGAAVKLFLNDKENEVLADSDGKFSKKFDLKKGENTVYALAVDASGNQSQKSPVQKTIFDNEPPQITIDSPSDGSSFFGSKQRQLVIKGKTKAGSDLTINDRFVDVDDNGNFTFATSLSEGENTFNLKAVDKAGNTAEKSLKVTFTP